MALHYQALITLAFALVLGLIYEKIPRRWVVTRMIIFAAIMAGVVTSIKIFEDWAGQ